MVASIMLVVEREHSRSPWDTGKGLAEVFFGAIVTAALLQHLVADSSCEVGKIASKHFYPTIRRRQT